MLRKDSIAKLNSVRWNKRKNSAENTENSDVRLDVWKERK